MFKKILKRLNILKKGFFFTILFSCFLFSNLFSSNKNHILWLMENENFKKAISSYRNLLDKKKEANFELLQKMCFIIQKKGVSSKNLNVVKRTIFSTSISFNEKTIDILEKAFSINDIETQMLSLSFLSAMADDKASNILVKAMNSKFLEIRLKAAYFLSLRKHKLALKEVLSLMNMLPNYFKPFFVNLISLIKTEEATKILINLLNDKNPDVRTTSILSIASQKRDDLILQIRNKLDHSTISEKEAAIYALGLLNDSFSIEKIEKTFIDSSLDNIKLAASIFLFKLKKEENPNIKMLAEKGNLFAISYLKNEETKEDILEKLSNSENMQIRLNAAISLLKRKNKKCVKSLKEIFSGNVIIKPITSVGRTLHSFQFAENINLKENEYFVSLQIKEELLRESLQLEEKDFLEIANFIFKNNIKELIPFLCKFLTNKKSKNNIDLLKEQTEKLGSPFIRAFCNIYLFKSLEDEKYQKYIKNFVNKNYLKNKVVLTPFSKKVKTKNIFQLSDNEHSLLFFEILNSLSLKKNLEAISFLLKIWENSNILDKYIISGFLLKAIE